MQQSNLYLKKQSIFYTHMYKYTNYITNLQIL